MKIKMFLAGILLFGLNSSVQADVTFNNIETYVASYGSGLRTSMVFTVDVLTPHGAYQGTYSQGGVLQRREMCLICLGAGPEIPRK